MKFLYFGFHSPYFRKDGRPHPTGWFGHCEAWGVEDETWTFIDPQAKGLMVRSYYRHEDVMDQLNVRFMLCESILRIDAKDRPFRLPAYGMMTCAAVCGALIGIRALVPSGLRRKLLLLGAEVIRNEAQARPNGVGSTAA